MFSSVFKPTSLSLLAKARNFSTSNQNNVKVAVVGAAGGIGQPLSLLLKVNPLITKLNMYDIAPPTPGVAKDVSHIETASEVCGFVGNEQLCEAVRDVDIIVIPAGMPRKPGMSRDDLFDVNATIIQNIADVSAQVNPDAMVAIITNPVNSTLPIVCETYKKHKVFDPRRIFGCTTLDISRANRFVAELKCLDPSKVNVPVIGGHSGITILPILSHVSPCVNFTDDEIKMLIPKIQDAGTEVVKAKAGAGSATLSMAYAGARFVNSLARAIRGEKNVIECTMVKSDICPAIEYFASPIQLGKCGVEKNLGVPDLTKYEEELLSKAIPELKKEIAKGVAFKPKK